MNQVSKQRRRLWHADPRCHWCGRRTILTPPRANMKKLKVQPPNLATVDHLRSRRDPTRQEPTARGDERRRVLACWECNQKRGLAPSVPKEEDKP